ncbi:hypothetical protein GCM10018952_18110 [Streptosporangium vulgare]
MLHRREPYQRPETRLPPANEASSSPAMGLAPRSSANATVIRSTEPNTAPIARNAHDISATPGMVIGVPAPACLGRTGGSVPRCSAKATVPTTVQVRATIRPAYGLIMVARAVTSAGPATKMTSSATDSKENAVCSLPRPGQQVRPAGAHERAERESAVAPTATPVAKSVQRGAPWRAQSIRPVSVAPCVNVRGTTTLAWPNLSTRRPDSGAATAKETLTVAATAPAVA